MGKPLINIRHQHIAQKLALSELRYRRLFEAAQDGILILDAITGRIIDVNPFLKKILGYSQSELLGKELWQIGVFKDKTDSKVAFLELQNKGYIRYKDLPLQTKNGATVDVEFISNVYAVGHEKVIQCNIRDISDRKKADEVVQLRTQELEQLGKTQEKTKQAMLNVMEDLEMAKVVIEAEKAKDEAMFASIGEGLIAVDNNRRITLLNKAVEDMLGWKRQDLIGKVITTLPLENESGQPIPLEQRPTYLALSTGKITNAVYFFVRKDKTRFPLVINVTPIILGGKTIGLIETLRDITHETKIDRAKTEFVSLASHQLRTPLGIAKWYIEAIKEEGYLDTVPEIAKDYFNEIYKSNERLLVLVRGLLSISRIDQGKVENIPKQVLIADLLQETIKNLTVLATKQAITLELKLQKFSGAPTIFVDPFRLQEVLENLITNAIMYSVAPGKVTITVSTTADQIHISVTDTGIGISKYDQKNLFTKFFRSEAAIAKNTEGSGLGLYVVKSYVDGWGGTITVDSKEGKGSTFSVTLPLTHSESAKS